MSLTTQFSRATPKQEMLSDRATASPAPAPAALNATVTAAAGTGIPVRSNSVSHYGPGSGPSVQGMRDQQGNLIRSRTTRRDDTIRRKAENELSKKATSKRMSVASIAPLLAVPSPSKRSKGYSNTVASLKPNQAITVLETARIVQAAQLMAAKRADAVLVVNEDGQLSGILTDKDIAFRVVAEGLDLRSTTVSQCMTRNPVAVLDKGPRNEALSVMVSRRFRHLPVISADEEENNLEGGSEIDSTTATSTNVVGLLDITKCVFDRLDDLEKKVLEDANIVAAMEALERRGHLDTEQVGIVRSQHGCPDLHSVLTKQGAEVPEVTVKSTVRDAARVMKACHQTAVLVLSAGNGLEDKLGGIFTTKDIVLRVIAAGLDPAVTSVVRVMTPHPDSVDASTSILDALKKLHIGHYLHLPVVEHDTPVGLVDVMTLTLSMLDYLMSKDNVKVDPENAEVAATITGDGPMWNKFWNSTFNSGSIVETESHASLDDDSHSISSGNYNHPSSPHHPSLPRSSYREHRHSVFSNNSTAFNPNQYAMHPQSQQQHQFQHPPAPSTVFSGAGGSSGSTLLDSSQFGFKLRDKRSGKIHRFTSSSSQITEVLAAVRAKLGDVGPGTVSYEDDDGDAVLLGSNADLEEAVGMARRHGWERLVLQVGEEAPPLVSQVASPVKQNGVMAEVKGTKKEVAKRRGSAASLEGSSVADFLKDAPLAVNVAISAGIVVVAAFVISRMQRM